MKALTIILTLFAVAMGMAVVIGRDMKATAAIAAQVDTVRITDSVRHVVAETVTVRARAKARLDTLVQTVTDTQLVVRETPAAPPETVTVHPLVVERIRTDSALIVGYRFKSAADSLAIASRDKLIALQTVEGPWGLGITVGYGCSPGKCGPQLTVGVTYQVKLPRLRLRPR